MKLLKCYGMILQWLSYKGAMKCTSSSIEKAHNWKRHKSAKVGKCIGVPEENNVNISGLIGFGNTCGHS